jgi:Tim44-like domain
VLKPGVLLAAALLGLLPTQASAAAMAGLSTSVGLAGSLLALLALQGGSSESAATALGSGVVLLMLGVLAWTTRANWATHLAPLPGLRRDSRPMLARAARTADERALLGSARRQFLRLQAAWDAGDLDTLRSLTTEAMFAELAAQLPMCGAAPNRTDVLSLEAHLISVEVVGPLELASIEFSGVVRESEVLGAMPFREVWMLAREPAEGGWRLARQQALL